MFELDKAIDDWCRAVPVRGHRRQAMINELKDHIYCDVEKRVNEGLSPERAFDLAVKGMGDVPRLATEYNKNWSPRDYFYYLKERRDGMKPAKVNLWIIAVSLLFAAFIIGAKVWTDGKTYSDTLTWLLLAVWFIPYSWFTLAKENIEYACIRRTVTNIIRRM